MEKKLVLASVVSHLNSITLKEELTELVITTIHTKIV